MDTSDTYDFIKFYKVEKGVVFIYYKHILTQYYQGFWLPRDYRCSWASSDP